MRQRNGRFAAGNPGGPGRPSRAREELYAKSIATVCDETAWKAICQRAVKDAQNGDARAREWLTRYLIGDGAGVPDVDEPGIKTVADVNDFWEQLGKRLEEISAERAARGESSAATENPTIGA